MQHAIRIEQRFSGQKVALSQLMGVLGGFVVDQIGSPATGRICTGSIAPGDTYDPHRTSGGFLGFLGRAAMPQEGTCMGPNGACGCEYEWLADNFFINDAGEIVKDANPIVLCGLSELLDRLRSIKIVVVDENENEIEVQAFPIPEDINENGIEDIREMSQIMFDGSTGQEPIPGANGISFTAWYCGLEGIGETNRIANFPFWATHLQNATKDGDWESIYVGPFVMPTAASPDLLPSACEACQGYCARENSEKCFNWGTSYLCSFCAEESRHLGADYCPVGLGIRNLLSILRYNPLLAEKGVTMPCLYPGTKAIDSLTEIYEEYTDENCQAQDCDGTIGQACQAIYDNCYSDCATDNAQTAQDYCNDYCTTNGYCENPEDQSDTCLNCLSECQENYLQEACGNPCKNDQHYKNCLKNWVACKNVVSLLPIIKYSIQRIKNFEEKIWETFVVKPAELLKAANAKGIIWNPTYCWKDSQGKHCVGVDIAPFPMPYVNTELEIENLNLVLKGALDTMPGSEEVTENKIPPYLRIKVSRYDSNPEEQNYPFFKFRFSRVKDESQEPLLSNFDFVCPANTYCEQPNSELVWQILDNYGITVYSTVSYGGGLSEAGISDALGGIRLVNTSAWDCAIPYVFGGTLYYWFGHAGCNREFEGWNNPYGEPRETLDGSPIPPYPKCQK